MAKKTSLDELYSYLNTFHSSDSLYLIGMINAAMKYGYDSLAKEVSYPVIKWLYRLSPGDRFSLSTHLTKLARFLLLSEANDQNAIRLELNSPEFEKAIDIVATLYDEDVEVKVTSAQDRSKLIGRITQSQFPLQDNRKRIIGRGFLIFVEIPALLKLTYDIDLRMQQYFGFGSFEFMATGMIAWMKTSGSYDYDMLIGVDALKSIVTDENQIRFLNLSVGTSSEFKELIRGTDWTQPKKLNDIYGANPFVKIPVIKAEKNSPKQLYIVPQPKYLLDRASSGIFHLLAAKEREIAFASGKMQTNEFRAAFGDIYRHYVGLQLNQKNANTTFIDLDADFVLCQAMKKPDFAMINKDVCILFEVKTSLLQIETRSYFEEEALYTEIKGGSMKKAIQQLSTFKEAILANKISDDRFKGIRRVISVIVGYEDIYVLNSSLLPILKKEYGIMAEDLQLVSVSDIDAIGSTIASGAQFVELVAKKLDAPGEELWSLESWLPKAKSENPILSKGFDLFLEKLGLEDEHRSQ